MGQGANGCGFSTNKESTPEENHNRGRQKAAKNDLNLEINISA